MCGISGIYNYSHSENISETIKQMTNVLSHRGPDGEGFYFSDNKKLALGHRRLAIIDLTSAASQPMKYLSRYIITYNGELYNYIELRELLVKHGYKFHSNSDTEVLLAMYDFKKEKCLDYLDGMFAFAIYDSSEEILFCARDRFGEKPFYYFHEEGKRFLFASEMKSLFAEGMERSVNHQMLYNYLAWNYVNNPLDLKETFYNDIYKLPSSHYLIVNKNLGIKIYKYWDIDIQKQNTEISFEDASEKVKKLLFESVSLRLRSDVAIGSSLSGGLDSSIVVSIINELNPENKIRQKTFSARFKDFDKDEGKYIDKIISRTNAEAYSAFPDADALIKDMDSMFYHQEEPFLSSSILAQFEVMKLAKQNGVKVLLDGQGADEVFGGYDYHMRAYFQELYLKNRKKYNEEWEKLSKLSFPAIKRDLKFHSQAILRKYYTHVEKIKTFRKPDNYTELNKGFYSEHTSSSFQKSIRSKPDFNYMLYESSRGENMEQILRYADRNSMAHSTEVRLPFLSHKLIEFLFTLPESFKVAEGWPKYLLRKSFEHILPFEIAWRKDKISFETPQGKWMSNAVVKDWIHESKSLLVSENFLDKKIMDKSKKSNTMLDWRYWMASKLVSKK